MKNKKIRHLEKEIESFFSNLSYKLPIKEADINSLKEKVQLFLNFSVGMNFGENEITKKVNLYNSYKESIHKNLLGVVDPNLVNFLLEICERIIACYSKMKASSVS